jgi:preprotein translocase subunit SecG
VFLILVVLLQTGKRADLAGAFGSGGSQTAFGARGAATLLAKVTTASAVLFMVIALALAIMSSRQGGGGGTVLDEVPTSSDAPVPIEAPLGSTEEQPVEYETSPVDDPSAPLEEGEGEAPAPEGDATEEETQP